MIKNLAFSCINRCDNGIINYKTCIAEYSCRENGRMIESFGSDFQDVDAESTCSDNCQGCIDDVYMACGDCKDNGWGYGRENETIYKGDAESMGCNGATHTDPMLFALVAAAVGHFLN